MKKKFNLANKIAFHTLIFWIIYTIMFLFIDGWHWTAISPLEKILDNIVDISFTIAFIIFFLSMLDAVKYCINMKEDTDKLMESFREASKFFKAAADKEAVDFRAVNELLEKVLKEKIDKKE